MITWLKDFLGLQVPRRSKEWGSEKLRIGQTFGEKPCVVREEDRRRYSVAPGPHEIPEDLKRIAKWQPGELERMSDKIIARVVEPILLREKEKCRIEKALEFSRGYADGQKAERERAAKIVESAAIQFDRDLQAHEPRKWDEGYKWKMSDRERSEREPVAIYAINTSARIRSGE